MINRELIFKQVNGKWLQVNTSAGDSARTLADAIQELEITIDDNAQFCRIIRYYDDYIETITYRAYTLAKVTITITYQKYE